MPRIMHTRSARTKGSGTTNKGLLENHTLSRRCQIEEIGPRGTAWQKGLEVLICPVRKTAKANLRRTTFLKIRKLKPLLKLIVLRKLFQGF